MICGVARSVISEKRHEALAIVDQDIERREAGGQDRHTGQRGGRPRWVWPSSCRNR